MPNTFLTPSIIGREALMLLSSNMVASALFNRGRQVEWRGQAVGDSISIRNRASFTVDEFTEGTPITVQSATERSVTLTLEKHFDISFEVTSKDWTLNLDDFSEQLLAPAMLAMAEKVDSYLLEKGTKLQYNFVGTAGDPPDSIADLADIDKKLNDQKCPTRGRIGILDTTANRDMISIATLHEADKRGDQGSALRQANIGSVMNVSWFMDQNVYQHTAGSAGGQTGATNGAASADDTTIDIDGFTTTDTLLVGDLLTIDGGQYVVTADNTASSGAFTNVAISPALRADVADGATVVAVDSHAKNFVGNPAAVTYAAVPLELPMGAANAQIVQDGGMGIRVVSEWNGSLKKDVISLDLLIGAVVQHEDLAVTLLG